MKPAMDFLRYPLSNKVFFPTILVVLATFGSLPVYAQSTADASNPEVAATGTQARIERARALVAAHQLDARRPNGSLRVTAQDDSVRNVASLMLMSIALKRELQSSRTLLEETFKARQIKKDVLSHILALAGRQLMARVRTLRGIETLGQRCGSNAA